MSQKLVNGRKRKPLSQLSIINHCQPTLPKKSRPNGCFEGPRRAGVIIRMVLRNFMCHSLLDVDFSTNITMMIGRNGSGKSAVLTALVVGLGGKAITTNRGSSIKNFIKAGRNSCSIEIELCNEGAMAYRPGTYGSKIIISRHISASGSSSYKVKAENGEVVASQAREVKNITTGLNIQVDNPICILNQDTSRNFLNSNDPKQKFTLFMRATKLETLAEEYKTIAKNKADSTRIIEQKKAHQETMQNELKTLKKKVEDQQSIADIQEKVGRAQVELWWAKVRDCEAELSLYEADIAKNQKKYDAVMNDRTNKSARLENIKKQIQELQQQVCELAETIKIQSRPQDDVRRVLEELRDNYNKKKQEKHRTAASIESKTRDLAIVENEIANINENLSRAEQEKVKRMRDLKTMEDKLKNMDDHLQTCRNDLYQVRSDESKKDEEKQNLRHELGQVERQISNEKSTLNTLKNESGSSLSLYGPDIPRVKQAIEQNKHRFKHVPRGPLGSYIKLKDRTWAVAVEGFLSPGLLSAFAVDNGKDNKILIDIFNRVMSGGRKPMVITSQFVFKKYDVRDKEVEAPPDCPSIYDALEIEDPVVSNIIIDNSSIENVLLFPTNARAIQLMSNRAQVPRNCRQGVTVDGDKYFPDPNYKTYGSRYKRAKYLQIDTKEVVRNVEHSIRTLTERKNEIQQQFNVIAREAADQEGKRAQLEEKIRKLNNAKAQIRRQLEELKTTAEPEVASAELLENELREIRTSLNERNASVERITEELRGIKTEIAENEEKLAQLRGANSGLQERIRNLEAQVEDYRNQQVEISTSDEFNKRRAREFKSKMDETHASMAIIQQKLKHLSEQAEEIGSRLETRRSVQEIMTEINHYERSVKRIENESEKFEDVYQRYQELGSKLKQIAAIMVCLSDNISELDLAVSKRKRHYVVTENYFTHFIKHAFKKVLEFRQFQGRMDIDIMRRKLDLIVMPQQGSQGHTATSNLSGGERSFSTVAFLYSLWQCMEFPFYFLDEFDVFMDRLNRTKVIELLLHHAKSHGTLQFVFLTPQDAPISDNTITILRLASPERQMEI